MAKLIGNFGSRIARQFAVLAVVAILTAPSAIADITVTVVDSDGNAVNGFRYLVEEDPTVQVIAPEPGVPDTSPVLAFQFHASHAPVVISGESEDTANSVVISSDDLSGAGPYFITVNPFSDHALSGVNASDGDDVTVTVNVLPMPSAQISILVFRDDILNGAPDLPQEIPGSLASDFDPTNFSVILEEPGGKYGIPGGAIFLDAFGNPLGTTYLPYVAGSDPVVDVMGDGVLTPGPNGVLIIKNLVPAKYGIIVVPPQGEGWIQTSTIEGSKVVDAWVSSDEPPFFVEFGPPGHHVFIGFTQEKHDPLDAAATGSVSGQIRNMHMSRPPNYNFYAGNPFPDCWVGLLPGQGGDVGAATHVQPCDDDSSFLIENVDPGDHTLVVFDTALSILIAQLGINVGTDALNLTDVPVFNWFGRLDASIFHDANGNGKRDEGEEPIHADKAGVTLRFRDGTVYQDFPVDTEGFAPFDTVFPFFHWLVVETSFANLKATGATYWVDGGGPVDLSNGGNDVFNPQAVDSDEPVCGSDDDTGETCTNSDGSRTLRGPVLTLGMQTFLGQTNKIEFGKAAYDEASGENGGISGIVFYAVTRAENDPRVAAAEEWEPGIPRVQVNLYQSDGTRLGKDETCAIAPDYRADLDGDGCITEPDVDVYPLGDFPGPGDTDRDSDGIFDYGDAVQVTWTDSWDDNQPTNCQGSNNFSAVPANFPGNPNLADANKACFDGIRNWNQIREAVFDGGYAFDSYLARYTETTEFGIEGDLTGETIDGLPTNIYIVHTITPPGYTLLKEEDRNVDFGDSYIQASLAKTGAGDFAIRQALGDLPIIIDPDLDLAGPAACVGAEHLVQDEFSYLTHPDGTLLPGVEDYGMNPDNEAPYRGEMRRLCDQKVVTLTPGKNTAADFFVFTQAPISANVKGAILNDLGNEFDFNSPNFNEKAAPPYLPIGFYDWNGNLISRTHADKYGAYNARLPSTVTINVPMPSGVSPYMATACMNDAAMIDDGMGNLIHDPHFDSRYSQFCYTLQFMPGSTTYLDTPVLPISAFVTSREFPLDCEIPQDMPAIYSVTNSSDQGPFVAGNDNGNPSSRGALADTVLTITADSLRRVRNPAYDGVNGEFIERDNGFGDFEGTVTLAGVAIPLAIGSWTNDVVTATVPQLTPVGDYQLTLTTAAGFASPVGVTVTIGETGQLPLTVGPDGTYTTIQAAIDAASNGDLITVAPGNYDELVIMHKAVRLQGWGAYGTVINASKFPARKLKDWRDKIDMLFADGEFTPLPSQETGFNPSNNEPDGFFKEEGAGITVVANRTGPNRWQQGDGARIDGFGVTGASHGGGIFINGYAKYLTVSNNHVFANQGTFGGGIRAGDSFGLPERGNGEGADNDHLNIHHNHIAQNGANGGSGAGISLYTGTDDYSVTDNWICGNFSSGDGGGIGHQGLSTGGIIADNLISFNQSFNQGNTVHGGGISIAGIQLLNEELNAAELTEGSGDVTITGNVIIGNQAGAGDGGGLALRFVDGDGAGTGNGNGGKTNLITVTNNVIANNLAGLTGAGISLQDTLEAVIDNNTITNNDSTATAGLAFVPGSPGFPNQSVAQTGAGIVSRQHSPALVTELGVGFSDPALNENIIWNNRVFKWTVTDSEDGECFHLVPYLSDTQPDLPGCTAVVTGQEPVYSDLAVIGIASSFLSPMDGILTDATGYDMSNSTLDPDFTLPISNGEAGQGIQQIELTTAIAIQPTTDEGGNYIDLQFGPLSMGGSGNYNELFSIGATNLGADSSRWQVGFKVAASLASAGSTATSSGSTTLSLSGVSATGASGYGGININVGEDEETEEEAPAEDAVKSITLDLGGISMDAIGQNVTNEQSN